MNFEKWRYWIRKKERKRFICNNLKQNTNFWRYIFDLIIWIWKQVTYVLFAISSTYAYLVDWLIKCVSVNAAAFPPFLRETLKSSLIITLHRFYTTFDPPHAFFVWLPSSAFKVYIAVKQQQYPLLKLWLYDCF